MSKVLQMPAHPEGKRARKGDGRARAKGTYLRLQDRHLRLLDTLAACQQVTRTVVMERLIEEEAARLLIPE